MSLSTKAQNIYSQINSENSKLGDIRKIAKAIKRDHELAMELWSTQEFLPRMLACLIMDKNLLTQDVIDELASDIKLHKFFERNQITDWLMANQLMKNKKIIPLIESWEHNPSPVLRRIFWYYQSRLRWSGKTPPDNAETLLPSLEKNMENEEPEVQWAMNFTTFQIGLNEPQHRDRCIALGERLGLYKDEKYTKGCTPNYIPDAIKIELAKRKA